MTRATQLVQLTLFSDVVDVWKAATQAQGFREWIATRNGCDVSLIGTYHALLHRRPWDTVGVEAAPWRVIRADLARLGY